LLAGCVISIESCTSTPSVWAESTESRTLAANGLERLECTTDNGSIRAIAAPGDIELTVRRRGGGADQADAEACLAAIEITEEREGDVLRLGWRWSEPERSTWGTEVSFDLRVPPGLELRATTLNGGVGVSGVTAAVTVETGNGAVDLRGCSGPVRVETQNGGIRADLAGSQVQLATKNGGIDANLEASGPLSGSLTTMNGAISVGITDAASTKLSCVTTNGGVRVTRALGGRGASQGSFQAQLGAGEGALEVRTVNGAITVR
jgi:hypothetical protein